MFWNKRIKDLRENYDLSRIELADKLEISERTLSRYENGESEPTISILIKLSLIFNVSIDYICCIKDNPEITEKGLKNELCDAIDILTKIARDL